MADWDGKEERRLSGLQDGLKIFQALLAIMGFLLAQTAIIVWWGATLSSKVGYNTEEIGRRREIVYSVPVVLEMFKNQDRKIEYITQEVGDIKKDLNKLINRA